MNAQGVLGVSGMPDRDSIYCRIIRKLDPVRSVCIHHPDFEIPALLRLEDDPGAIRRPTWIFAVVIPLLSNPPGIGAISVYHPNMSRIGAVLVENNFRAIGRVKRGAAICEGAGMISVGIPSRPFQGFHQKYQSWRKRSGHHYFLPGLP